MLVPSRRGSVPRIASIGQLLLTSPHHRFENLHIAGAATEIAGQAVANLRFTRMGILFQQIHRGQDHPRRADPTLRAAAFNKGLLHGVQLIVRGDPFDGLNRRAGNLRDRHQATIDDPAIDHHRTGATLAFATTLFGAGQTQLLAQNVEQTFHRVGMQHPALAVNGALHGALRIRRIHCAS